MKRTAYFCALMLALCLCACGSTKDAQVTSSPAPTLEIIPQTTAEPRPDISSPQDSKDGMMTDGSVTSPSSLPDASPAPAVSEEEASSGPALANSAAE